MLKGDRTVFGKLVRATTNQPMTPRQKGNSNHCVNMSASELTPTIPRQCTDFQHSRGEYRGGIFVSAVVCFAFGTLLLVILFVQGNRLLLLLFVNL